MSTTPNASRVMMTASFTVLLAITALLWAGTVANAITIRSSDAAGNALSHAFGVLMVIALFVLLGIVVILAAVRGSMPVWMRLAAIVLIPASGAATVAAIEVLSQQTEWPVRWPLVVPILAPAAVIALALWASVQALRGAASAGVVGATLFGLLAILSLAPWPLLRERARIRRAGPGELQAIRAASRAKWGNRERDAERAQLESIEAESSLYAWLPFAEPGSPLRDRALTAIQRLPERQREAEEMVRAGNVAALREVPNLGVEATPALCEAAREAVTYHARQVEPDQGSPAYPPAARDVEFYMPTVEWLIARGCDLDGALTALDSAARAFAEAPERQRFIERLAGLRRQTPR